MRRHAIWSTLTFFFQPEEDETIWYIPLELKTVDKDGKVSVNHKAILDSRETIIPLPDAPNTTYKLNAETAGVYHTLYPPERWAKLGQEAKNPRGGFSLNDRWASSI
jgi:aminopeptidase 2